MRLKVSGRKKKKLVGDDGKSFTGVLVTIFIMETCLKFKNYFEAKFL